MTYSKNILKIWILVSSILVFNACNNSTNSSNANQKVNDKSNLVELKVGGLYITKENDNTYSVSKILAMDDFAVHLRMYSNKFQTKPTQLSSKELNVLIGHSPLDKQAFLAENPELLKIETVDDSELEGYKLYLDEMNKDK